MSSQELTILYVTFDSEDEALKIASHLLEKKMIACANILSPMTSVYKWKGEVQKGQEWPVLFKTSIEKLAAVRSDIVDMHSYDTPCVIELTVESVNDLYHQWAIAEIQ